MIVGPPLLLDLGAAAGSVTAILALAILVSKLPPARWMWRQLVSGPMDRWTRALVGEVVAEQVEPLKDQIDRIDRELSYDHGTSVKDMTAACAEKLGIVVYREPQDRRD